MENKIHDVKNVKYMIPIKHRVSINNALIHIHKKTHIHLHTHTNTSTYTPTQTYILSITTMTSPDLYVT